MKKFYLFVILALLGAMSASAQIKVTCEGKEVKDFDVLTFYAHPDEFGSIAAGPMFDPVYTAQKACEIKVFVKSTFGINAQWCISGSCLDLNIPNDSYTKQMAAGEELSHQLHVMFTEGNYTEHLVTVEVYADNNLVMTYYENFIYADPATGIGNATAEGKSVKWNGNALVYNFAAAANRSMQVYAADGKLVKSAPVLSQSGSVSLDGLQGGVYIYSLTENGKKVEGGKIVRK